jgi:hypothetical protein
VSLRRERYLGEERREDLLYDGVTSLDHRHALRDLDEEHACALKSAGH